jgi:hypothetical protein
VRLTSVFSKALRQERSPVHTFLAKALRRRDAWAKRMRVSLRSAIGVASRHQLLTKDGLARLNSPSDRTFWSFLNELKVAGFFEERGIRLTFHPRGAGSSIGEFLAHLPSGDVFVEVKTMFPRPDEEHKQRIAKEMCIEIEGMSVPGIYSVGVHKEAPTFSQRKFRHFVRNAIIPQALASSNASQLYTDPSGLTALINYPLHDGKLLACMPTVSGWIQDSIYIRASVESALKRLPKDGNNLVVVCDELVFSPAPTEFIEALFNEYRVNTSSGLATRPAFMSPNRNRRVSAVAQFDTEWNSDLEQDTPFLYCYHHPDPYTRLDVEDWNSIAKNQYFPTQGWLN